jgi:hypothetical protein
MKGTRSCRTERFKPQKAAQQIKEEQTTKEILACKPD